MSAVGESFSRRVTLDYIATHYGFELDPEFAKDVTVTSIADRPESVEPGALFVAQQDEDCTAVSRAAGRGAYAALVSSGQADAARAAGIPHLVWSPSPRALGALAADITDNPGGALAVFVVCGNDDDRTEASAVRLADFLHMLGNPVGLLSKAGSMSLERDLELEYPLGILDVQHALSVCSEDGAAAMVVSAESLTLRSDALQSVDADVLGTADRITALAGQRLRRGVIARYGLSLPSDKPIVTCSEESLWLAGQAHVAGDLDGRRRLALAIAMAMAVGVRKSNIRNALRVSGDMA
ncbi:hypothetical protein GA0061078_1152 [Bifidobacterium bohemicum]|uniref:Putative UDP-N-acetylmuramoylalanyl-D-glutamate--2, 6-diaminopimelate ligase n=1 Tax=Bifidobacterium bohemicum DSM 22767 TaxID=1437606 RepID=A0A086ZGF6_9BIFI|nr:hypothetical protein [Bifidobacterium bohemicum]KFI45606.1 putative UDP-N-acetylmuramoylalanyl-D-glutamate--2, 6-diaminopimelate ligase [Bifidobacterium bohemicum DSM 22767]SCC00796.1 hypothetical protein GA0061078_1152 [Bifidobacterium bohemicum]